MSETSKMPENSLKNGGYKVQIRRSTFAAERTDAVDAASQVNVTVLRTF